MHVRDVRGHNANNLDLRRLPPSSVGVQKRTRDHNVLDPALDEVRGLRVSAGQLADQPSFKGPPDQGLGIVLVRTGPSEPNSSSQGHTHWWFAFCWEDENYIYIYKSPLLLREFIYVGMVYAY